MTTSWLKHSIIGVSFLLILISFFGTACISIKPIYYDDDKKIAQQKIEDFHQLYNDEKFKEMYDLLSPQTRNVLTFENFSLAFKEVRKINGKVKKSMLIKEGVKAEASYRIVELIYKTEFENYTLREGFLCHVEGENAVIHFIDKPAPFSKDE